MDLTVAFHHYLKDHPLISGAALKRAGLRCQVSSFDPFLVSIFRETGSAVGALTTHIDDTFGRGEPDVPPKIRDFSARRFGEFKLQDSSLLHVGMELVQDGDFSVTPTQDEFAKNLRPLPSSPRLREGRRKTLPFEDVNLCQCKLVELCWPATASGPDFGFRFAFPHELNRCRDAMYIVLMIWRRLLRRGNRPQLRSISPPPYGEKCGRGWGRGNATKGREGSRLNHDSRGTVECGL